MAAIKIYNSNQIGGNYTVISSNGTKIMIDYGQALPGTTAEQEDFDWETDTVDAVLFTHYHGDHVGRILEIPSHIPIYMGSTARQIMLNIHRALAGVEELQEEQLKYINLLEDKQRIREFVQGVPCEKIGDIEVVPYSVDHSAYDAYMLLIKTPEETILHTGDFREHGYRGSKMVKVIKKLVLPQAGGKIDTLIIEGTMMERQNEKVRTEWELQQEAAELFKKNKYVFLVCSSTNLDTLTSFHKAALKNGMYTYCYSKYLLGQLETFTKTAGQYSDLYKFDKTYLVELDKELGRARWKETKTQEQFMRENGFLCMIKPEVRYAEWVERFADLKPLVIYALWDGYLNPKRDAYNKEWADFFQPYKENGQFKELHTSGHATPETIAKIIEAVQPQKRIYPMHTGKAEEFKRLAIKEEYKDRLFIPKVEDEIMQELTKEELRMLVEMKDNRSVSDELTREFYDGSLVEFRKFILEYNTNASITEKIAVLLRGNSNSIIVYYHNHKLWELSVVKKGRRVERGRVSFNFDHARYTKNWREIFQNLIVNKGFICSVDNKSERLKSFPEMKIRKNDKGDVTSGTIGTIHCDKEYFSNEFVKESFQLLQGLIDDFFDTSAEHTKDEFRELVKTEYVCGGMECSGTRTLIEKIWQQRLFFELRDAQDGLFVYDLEFSQPFPNKKIRDKFETNEPDMFAIRFKENKPVGLVMIEVKSTRSACADEKSGIEKHLRGMYEYSKNDIFMRNRFVDAHNMMKQFGYFGFLPECFQENEIPEIPLDFPIERVLLLTNNYSSELKVEDGGAIKYFNNNKQTVLGLARKWKCQIWLTNSLYCNQEIEGLDVDILKN